MAEDRLYRKADHRRMADLAVGLVGGAFLALLLARAARDAA